MVGPIKMPFHYQLDMNEIYPQSKSEEMYIARSLAQTVRTSTVSTYPGPAYCTNLMKSNTFMAPIVLREIPCQDGKECVAAGSS